MSTYKVDFSNFYYIPILVMLGMLGSVSYIHWEYIMVDIFQNLAGIKLVNMDYLYTTSFVFISGCLYFLAGTRLFKQHTQVTRTESIKTRFASNKKEAAWKGTLIGPKLFPDVGEKLESKTVVADIQGHRVAVIVIIVLGLIIQALISYYTITEIYYPASTKTNRYWGVLAWDFGLQFVSAIIGITAGLIAYKLKTRPLNPLYLPK